jgi:Na+-translocating ferredoxin:NAD+ oxidoreductase RnfD subunit
VALAITLFKIGFGDSIEYKLLNLFGGVCLLYYAVIEQVIPFIILEATWVLLPLITLLSSKFRVKKPAESPN